MDQHQQELARLHRLQQTMDKTVATWQASRELLTDMLQAGAVSPAAITAARAIIEAQREVAEVAETAFLALFDALYPEASVFSYRVVGEAYFVLPA